MLRAMTKLAYELVEPIEEFNEGDVLAITQRFGDWHPYDVKLEPESTVRRGSIELTWDDLKRVATAPEASA